MKVKVLVDCVGVGFDFKKGQEINLDKKLAEKLLKFGYVEQVQEKEKTPLKNSKKAVK